MANLAVSSEYLTTLSEQMAEWRSRQVESAIAAVPGDWTTEGIVGLAIGGTGAIVGGGAAGYKYSDFAAKKFTVKGMSFKGEEVVLVANLAVTGYSIYSDLSSGNYWAAALDTLSLIPQGINLGATHNGLKELLQNAGGTTVILERTSYLLQGLYYSAGLASDVGEDFKDGAKQFSDGSAALRQLMPTSQWTGTASTSYAEVVRQLQTLMGDLAIADTQMANALRAEMDQLIITRNIIATARKTIELAIPAAVTLYFTPVVGPELSEAFQVVIASSAVASTFGALANQLIWCEENARRVDSQKAKYEAVQNKAHELYAKLMPAPLVISPSPGVRPSLTGSGSRSGGSVSAGTAQSNLGRRSTSGSGSRGSVNASEVPATAGSRSGGQTVSQGKKMPRPSASVKRGKRAAADKTGAAGAGAGPRPQARADAAIAERAPVDTASPNRSEPTPLRSRGADPSGG
jgi:hypothetical protein